MTRGGNASTAGDAYVVNNGFIHFTNTLTQKLYLTALDVFGSHVVHVDTARDFNYDTILVTLGR